ncbi:hypothetical protein H5410_005502 [Solanum commersonii]|uniref:Uncharacterized protein n=1 Tax=Solanum commersonii TaxID=4109 RepID=A0A9J6A7R1_SOLCO|nr:hypothetical protein H5410_005502 [Solanum commersonii]
MRSAEYVEEDDYRCQMGGLSLKELRLNRIQIIVTQPLKNLGGLDGLPIFGLISYTPKYDVHFVFPTRRRFPSLRKLIIGES